MVNCGACLWVWVGVSWLLICLWFGCLTDLLVWVVWFCDGLLFVIVVIWVVRMRCLFFGDFVVVAVGRVCG